MPRFGLGMQLATTAAIFAIAPIACAAPVLAFSRPAALGSAGPIHGNARAAPIGLSPTYRRPVMRVAGRFADLVAGDFFVPLRARQRRLETIRRDDLAAWGELKEFAIDDHPVQQVTLALRCRGCSSTYPRRRRRYCPGQFR